MQVLSDIFTEDQLCLLRSLPEVTDAYTRLQTQTSVSFSIPVTDLLKETLATKFSLDTSLFDRVPCRWVKGDTRAHVDRGSTDFDRTYIVYLTDGEGEFHLGEETYPIVAGTGYSFSEGLKHEVVGAGNSTRLLLGPMSESAMPVGAGISADGATETIYIRDNAGTVEYRINDGLWNSVSFALYINNINADPANNILKVIFTTNITVSNWNDNFWAGTDGIQFGSKSLNADGSRPTITVNNAPKYRGVFLNGVGGVSPSNGYNHIYIYNLNVVATGTSTLDDGTYNGYGGWVAGAQFGRGATNNCIVNCSSDGPIGDSNGGIIGSYAGTASGSVVVRGCSSSGSMTQKSGGIAGEYAGSSSGSITCDQCFSTGTIGNFAGGIFGDYAGDSGSATASKCYSTGTIGGNGGGIYGRYGGNNGSAVATKCYSLGTIAADAGGIYGLGAASDSGSSSASNCYSKGAITTSGTGIYGSGKAAGGTTANCYSANGSWSDATANTSLTGVPSGSTQGSVWSSPGTNQPYELVEIGYTPYTVDVINASSDLVQTFSQTIQKGQTSATGLGPDASGNSFSILKKAGGDSGSYATITISSQTGAISTTSATVSGTYTITVRSVGSYNITTFVLTVTDAAATSSSQSSTTIACCVTSLQESGIDSGWLPQYAIGNTLIGAKARNPNLQFIDYAAYLRYKMAQGSRKA